MRRTTKPRRSFASKQQPPKGLVSAMNNPIKINADKPSSNNEALRLFSEKRIKFTSKIDKSSPMFRQVTSVTRRLKTQPYITKLRQSRLTSSTRPQKTPDKNLCKLTPDKISIPRLPSVQKPPDKNPTLPIIIPSKTSTRPYNPIKCYSANTHPGKYRQYNEDRISILLNIGNNMHCFGVFDGHGGAGCAEYISNNLIENIVKAMGELGIEEAIRKAFKITEEGFMEVSRKQGERSGACAIVAVVCEKQVYIANLGDSRAVFVEKGGKVRQLTNDHRPALNSEKVRIESLGGKIYRKRFSKTDDQAEIGPLRVWPGRLSVSRAFGDFQAKDPKLGGIPNVISNQPELTKLQIFPSTLLILACDGVYDRLSNQDLSCLFHPLLAAQQNPHKLAGQLAQNCLQQSMKRDSFDNLSVICIAF